MQTTSSKSGRSGGPDASKALRELPSVAKALDSRPFRGLKRRLGTRLTTALLREELDRLRAEIRGGRMEGAELRRGATSAALAGRVERAAAKLAGPSPRVVINATGVVVHTNLGRSVLSEAAARRVSEAAGAYMDLEFDLGEGRRGSRLDHLAPLMGRLFPGFDFAVVNNNAAAIMMTLRALARGK